VRGLSCRSAGLKRESKVRRLGKGSNRADTPGHGYRKEAILKHGALAGRLNFPVEDQGKKAEKVIRGVFLSMRGQFLYLGEEGGGRTRQGKRGRKTALIEGRHSAMQE